MGWDTSKKFLPHGMGWDGIIPSYAELWRGLIRDYLKKFEGSK
jgi:hypothetical protein